MQTQIEPFSSGYLLVPEATAVEYTGKHVVVPNKMHDDFAEVAAGPPVLRLSSGHYRAHGEWGVPSNTVAVPSAQFHKNGEEILLAKNPEHVEDIVLPMEQTL